MICVFLFPLGYSGRGGVMHLQHPKCKKSHFLKTPPKFPKVQPNIYLSHYTKTWSTFITARKITYFTFSDINFLASWQKFKKEHIIGRVRNSVGSLKFYQLFSIKNGRFQFHPVKYLKKIWILKIVAIAYY